MDYTETTVPTRWNGSHRIRDKDEDAAHLIEWEC